MRFWTSKHLFLSHNGQDLILKSMVNIQSHIYFESVFNTFSNFSTHFEAMLVEVLDIHSKFSFLPHIGKYMRQKFIVKSQSHPFQNPYLAL